MDAVSENDFTAGVIFTTSPDDYVIDSIADSLTPVSDLPRSYEDRMLYPPLQQCGNSCVGYSLACSADSKYVAEHPTTPAIRFSPRFIYQLRSTAVGMSMPEALDIIRIIGCVTEGACPADDLGIHALCDADRTSCRTRNNQVAAAPFKINSYWLIFGLGVEPTDSEKVVRTKQVIHDLGAIALS